MTTTDAEEDATVSADDEAAFDTEQARQALIDKVVAEADARWRLRQRHIGADRNMDKRRKSAYLDKTWMTITDCSRLLDLSKHRISVARGGRKTANGVELPKREYPHPSVYPPPATVIDFVAGKPVYVWWRGEIIEWAEQRGLHLLDLDTGELIKMRNRSGRPRLPRTARSKPHVPGTPRRDKKTNTDE